MSYLTTSVFTCLRKITLILIASNFSHCEFKTTDIAVQSKLNSFLTDQSLKETESSEAFLQPIIIQPEPLKHAYRAGTESSLVSQYIRRIFQDKQAGLWFGTVGDGACRYYRDTLRYFTKNQFLNTCSVQDIKENRSGTLWFATNEGLVRYDGKSFQCLTEKNGLTAKHIQSLLIDHSGKVWAGTSNGLFVYDPLTRDSIFFKSISFPEEGDKKEIRCMMEDRNGKIWFCPKGPGLYVLERATEFQALRHFGQAEGLPTKQINYLIQDKKGIIWLASQGGGLIRHDPLSLSSVSQPFTVYKEEKGSNEYWYLLSDSKNNLWVSQRGSVRIYSPAEQAGDLKTFTSYSSEDGLTNCCVQSIFEDRSGIIWLGTGEGLFLVNPKKDVVACHQNQCAHAAKGQTRVHAEKKLKAVLQIRKDTPWPKLLAEH